jgi:hypothetical protein
VLEAKPILRLGLALSAECCALAFIALAFIALAFIAFAISCSNVAFATNHCSSQALLPASLLMAAGCRHALGLDGGLGVDVWGCAA